MGIKGIVFEAINNHFFLDEITEDLKIKNVIVDFDNQWGMVLDDIEVETDVHISDKEFKEMETVQDIIEFIASDPYWRINYG
jgi:hypothetical protein